MHELFKRICSLTDEDIYCSCWRHSDKECISLNSLMRDLGFEEVIKSKATWDVCHNCKSGRLGVCSVLKLKSRYTEHGKLIKEPCRCYEDLYLHRRL